MFSSDVILFFNFQQKQFVSFQKKKCEGNMLFSRLLKKKVKTFFKPFSLLGSSNALMHWSKNMMYGRIKRVKCKGFPSIQDMVVTVTENPTLKNLYFLHDKIHQMPLDQSPQSPNVLSVLTMLFSSDLAHKVQLLEMQFSVAADWIVQEIETYSVQQRL